MKRAHHRSDPSALAKLLVALTLAVCAPGASGQDAETMGPAAAAEPETAADAVPEPAEGEAETQAQASPQAKPRARLKPAPVAGAQAVAFAKRFAEVIAHELTVQKYEQQSLGAAPLRSLGDQRLIFRRRVDRDAAEFEARLATVPMTPIPLPRLSQAKRPLTPRERLLVGRINKAYARDRDQGELEFLYNTNVTFLTTENWGARDGVVRSRDALLDREIAYGDLAAQGRKILSTATSEAELDELEALLDEISPSTKTAESSVVQRLLSDPEFQKKVMDELTGVLMGRYDPEVPSESDEELLTALVTLQEELLEAAALTDVQLELSAIDSEISAIDSQLNDNGVGALSSDQRRTAAKRKTDLLGVRNKLQVTWNHTAPPEPQASNLITTQDALIRRRLHDLGAHGALFAHRYDSLRPETVMGREANPSISEMWGFFSAQAKLITTLDEARPAPNPLTGLSFRALTPAGGGIPKGLLGSLPKPQKGKQKGKKKGKGR